MTIQQAVPATDLNLQIAASRGGAMLSRWGETALFFPFSDNFEAMMSTLFTPTQIGPYTMSHRVVFAPMTRLRSNGPTHLSQ